MATAKHRNGVSMKNTLVLLTVSLLSITSLAATSFRQSDMDEDYLITSTLRQALKASYGKVPAVQTDGVGYSIAINNDKLSCNSSKCALQWDTVSATYPQDGAKFKAALYDVLYYWSQNEGKNNPYLQYSVYPQTGATQITIREGFGKNDEVRCSSFTRNGSMKECNFVVSSTLIGVQVELQNVFTQLQSAPSLIEAQKKAVMDSVHTDAFLSPGQLQYGNGTCEVTHTLYSDLLVDSVDATLYFAYKTPVARNGQVISNGVKIHLAGSERQGDITSLYSIEASSYALPHRIR